MAAAKYTQTHTDSPAAKSKTLAIDEKGDGDERLAPVEIEAKVIDNAYVELTIGMMTFVLYEDEMHRLRKVMDRAMIELPR